MQSVHEEHEYLEITAIHIVCNKTDLASLILIGLGSYSNLAQSIFGMNNWARTKGGGREKRSRDEMREEAEAEGKPWKQEDFLSVFTDLHPHDSKWWQGSNTGIIKLRSRQ